MSSDRCIAITKTGIQCTRRAVTDGYCTQHYNLLAKNNEKKLDTKNNEKDEKDEKVQINLPSVLTNHILSDYIEYDELTDLQKNIQNLHIDPKRIQIIEYDEQIEYLQGQTKDFDKKITYHIIEIIIDNVVRKKEIFLPIENLKRKIDNYNKNGNLNGISYTWFDNGELMYKNNYFDGQKQGFQYEWYPNGTLKLIRNYVNDIQDGPEYIWYNNGRIKYFGNYKNDKLDGDFYLFKYNDYNYYDRTIIYKYYVDGEEMKQEIINNTEADKIIEKYKTLMSEIADKANINKYT